MIVIDGSRGEGGGQILRTSLALALMTGQSFRIENIRAKRKEPGLLRQHLTAVRAAVAVGQAEVAGDALHSTQLTFRPGRLQPGDHTFRIGTAGSTTLVLQTVLPALLTAAAPSRLVLEGGTHNTHAPPFDFLAKAFVPLVNGMGPQVTLTLERHGFYPAGGGRFVAEIMPCPRLQPFTLLERGEIVTQQATALVANLRTDIARREVATIGEQLGWERDRLHWRAIKESDGPGNVVLIEVGSPVITEVFSAFGRLGVLAEAVAGEAVSCARAYLDSGAAVGEHLADQLLLPLALAGGGAFTAANLTLHATTNMETIGRFLPVRFTTERVGTAWRVEVQ